MNNDPVPQITDFSGLAHHATQADAGKQPVFITSAVGGKPGFRFDGTKYLNSVNAFLVGVDNYTIFIVFRSNSITNGSYIIGGTDATWNRWIAVRGYTAPRLDWEYGNRSVQNSAAFFDGNPMQVTVLDDGVAAKVYRNGIYVNQNTARISFAMPPGVAIGTFNQNGSFYVAPSTFVGDIAEIVVYDRGLSAGELTALDDYFKTKYGIA